MRRWPRLPVWSSYLKMRAASASLQPAMRLGILFGWWAGAVAMVALWPFRAVGALVFPMTDAEIESEETARAERIARLRKACPEVADGVFGKVGPRDPAWFDRKRER